MALLAIIVLVVLGLGMVGVGILALRDDAPRWVWAVPRPGRVLVLGLVALLVALIVNASRYDIAEDVTEYVGQQVNCEKVGALEVEGENRDVYSCVAAHSGGAHLGCFVRVGDGVVDVTRRAERPGAIAGGTPDC